MLRLTNEAIPQIGAADVTAQPSLPGRPSTLGPRLPGRISCDPGASPRPLITHRECPRWGARVARSCDPVLSSSRRYAGCSLSAKIAIVAEPAALVKERRRDVPGLWARDERRGCGWRQCRRLGGEPYRLESSDWWFLQSAVPCWSSGIRSGFLEMGREFPAGASSGGRLSWLMSTW